MGPFGIIFIIIGVIFIPVGIITVRTYIFYGKTAVATVTDIIHKDSGVEMYGRPLTVGSVEYTFVTEDGETVVTESKNAAGGSGMAVGDTIVVRYNPKNPYKIFIKPEGDDGSIKTGIIFTVIGAVAIILGVIIVNVTV